MSLRFCIFYMAKVYIELTGRREEKLARLLILT